MASNESSGVDLDKCRGLLINGLSKIQQQRQDDLPLTEKGAKYLEQLLIELLASLMSSLPKTVQDAKEQVIRKFPEPLSNWALEDAQTAQEKGKKKVVFSVDKIHHILKEQNSGMEKQVTLLYCAVLEYMASDILKLTADYALNISSKEITDQDVKIAMFADNILMAVFHCDEMEDDLVIEQESMEEETVEKHVSYESMVKDFMAEEARYLRDLNLIIKLIRKELVAQPKLYSEKTIDTIFSNVEDLAELSMKLISLLEEALEMTDESNPIPLVGSCFEDLAEECLFELYSDYTLAVTSDTWRTTFDDMLREANVTEHLQKVCPGFRNVVAYVLPNLLLAPIYHCFYYKEQIKLLEKYSPDSEDKQSLSQALGAFTPIKRVLEAKMQSLPKLRPSEASLRISWRGGPKASKMTEIEKSIDGWSGRSITQSCNEFLHEGALSRVGKRFSERHVFLFDFLLISCKNNQARLPTVAASQYEYRLKEKIIIRKAVVNDIIDPKDGPEKHQFEILEGEKGPSHIFQAKTKVDKNIWMAHLVRLQHRSTFDRMLDQIIREEAARQKLRLPAPDKYRFAEPDSNLNLVLEEDDSTSNQASNPVHETRRNQIDVIKGGTVLKLVERLTYHLYSDPSFTKTFLTTFRSFCKPRLLLELLTERYNIPDPIPTPEQQMAIDRGEIPNREDLKRFRKEYAKPIQLRVLNVIRQWLEHHWYDFQRDPELLEEVEKFIGSVRGKNMQKWARTIRNIISRKDDAEDAEPMPSFAEDPPVVEWHLARDPAKFNLFTLHPVEIARQLTLIEFGLYRKVQPSELVGSVWTKVGKETNSPNLLKMIHFSNKITRWVAKTIIEISNFDERIAAMIRAIEVMWVLKRLNNFNGLLEFVAAFNTSSVHRLNHTKESLPSSFSKEIKECMDLCDSRLTKILERLRSIDPPCVPFVGTFLTNILKTEEGNPHLLPNQPEHLRLINFSKRRKVAAIMLEVQQYQNQLYNLQVVPEIRDFFLNLDPLEGRTEKEFNDHLFHTSLKIEPRDVERPPKFPRVFSDKEIKHLRVTAGKRSKEAPKEGSSTQSRGVERTDSIKSISRHLEKRHSLFEDPVTPKPQSLDTMSVRSLAVFPRESSSNSLLKSESPPPRPPPREPRRPDIRPDDISAPPKLGEASAFPFDLADCRKKTLVGSSSVPQTAPPRTHNGIQGTGQISPVPVELLLERDPTPPPVPPRDSSIRNSSDRSSLSYKPVYFPKPTDRGPLQSNPPPIPPRDPPSVPPRVPVRPPPPYTHNYPDMPPYTPHVNGGRYVEDPTWEPKPPNSDGTVNPGAYAFENYPPAPPYTEIDPSRNNSTFSFPDVTQGCTLPSWATWGNMYAHHSGPEVPNRSSPHQPADVPPPVPRRQPSTLSMTSVDPSPWSAFGDRS